ncbi:MAG: hypothetical protein DWP97_13395 [Calditrichaeota bacterium]|nr:MAG: hypothetical protein DWP97_13395 [Calditrichota bacterium]
MMKSIQILKFVYCFKSWINAEDYPSRYGFAQRVAYQRKFVCGWIFLLVLSGAFSWWAYSYKLNQTENENELNRSEIVINESTKPTDTILPAKTSLALWTPYKDHEGFAGYNGYKIVEESYIPNINHLQIQQSVVSYQSQVQFADVISYSPIEGDELGLYLPKLVETDFFEQNDRINNDLEFKVLRKIDPEYPMVALDAGKEGKVSILVYVNEYGLLSSFPDNLINSRDERIITYHISKHDSEYDFQYIIVKEEPKDWFFADNLLEILPKWKFQPQVENGLAIPEFVIITYDFCLGSNCDKLFVKQLMAH